MDDPQSVDLKQTVNLPKTAFSMKANLPAPLAKYNGSAALDNPQVLLSPSASTKIHGMFAKAGAPGEALFKAFMHAVRLSLSTAISDLFLISAVVGLAGLIAIVDEATGPVGTAHEGAILAAPLGEGRFVLRPSESPVRNRRTAATAQRAGECNQGDGFDPCGFGL